MGATSELAHGWPLAGLEPGSKRLKGKEKIGAPVTKFAKSSILLGLVNSHHLWAGFREVGLARQIPNEGWEGAGLRAGWGLDTDHV